MSELWRLSAVEAVRLLKRREVSPRELIEAAARRRHTIYTGCRSG